MNKRKLSKTVLEMKFMKRTKIQQDKHDDETENIDVLTDQKVKGEKHSNFVIERNWELIENLRSSRMNFGMQTKNQTLTDVPGSTKSQSQNKDDEEYSEPRSKHIKFTYD